MIQEQEIINDAIRNLKRLTGLDNIEVKPCEDGYDYDFTINGTSFACEVKRQVNKSNYNLMAQKMRNMSNKEDKPLILVASYIVPDILDNFRRDNINVLQSNGNCDISSSPLYIHISGQKAVIPNETKHNAFNEAGLKVIFYFLSDEANINKPYRIICDETGVSLGTIKNVIDELKRTRYVFTSPKGRILVNIKQLLDIWQVYYNQTLKPKLKLKELEFVDSESRNSWEQIPLPEGVCWGGEGGAYIIDHYLNPELFDVYSEMPCIKLVMTKKLMFKENGRVKVYQKFWKGTLEDKVAPKILLYADLMGSGNSRCIEAAQRLVENGI